MRRLFWMSVGAAAGIYGVRRLTRAAEALLPQNLALTARSLTEEIRQFVDDVRSASADREAELSEALGLEPRRRAIAGDLAASDPHAAHFRRGTR